jgi:hypothetical protein
MCGGSAAHCRSPSLKIEGATEYIAAASFVSIIDESDH